MEEWLKVIVQGIVQGITEFLPISSTGHLLIFSDLLNLEVVEPGTFEIFIQIGTLVAVIAFYRVDLWQQARAFPRDKDVQRLWLNIVVASIPIAVLGFALLDFIEQEIFANEDLLVVVIAATLIIGGIVFLLIERSEAVVARQTTASLTQISLRQAVLVGIAQAFALIPGTSRSGATIIGALLVGLNRTTATAFSFYLAIPALGGATVLTFLFSLDEVDTEGILYMIVGAIVSGIVAWYVIAWLLRYVARHNFIIFGYYRIVAGVLLFLMLATGLI